MLQKPFPTAAITHGPTRSALLAIVLAGFVVSLFALSVPKAAAGPDTVAPTTPSNVRVTGATQTSVTLEWTKSTDSVGVEGYRVTFSWSKYKTPETRFTVTGLACGASYPVEVRAYDHARNVSSAATAIVSTSPCLDLQAPTAPSGLQQIANGPTTATLAWSAATDNVAVAGYAVGQGGVEVETTTETSWVFSGLACSRTYNVAVRAFDVASNSSIWVGFYVTTSSCGDVSAPTAPSGLTQTDQTVSTMSVAWSATTDNVGVARYAVFRNGAEVGSTTGLSYAFSGLTCGTAHTVGVEALDGASNRSARTTATMSTAPCVTPPPPPGDTQPPSTPTSLSVASVSGTSITLTWSPSTDNVGMTGYGLYRSGVRVQVVTGTTFIFQGLACGTSQDLGVEAYDAAGNQSGRAQVTASTSACSDPTPPTTPQNLVLLSRTSTSVTVSWLASTDNVGVAGYGAWVDGQLAGSTGATTYTFTGLACNTTRTFGIDAYDAAGNRSARANVALSTTACGDTQAPTVPSQLSVSNPTQTGLTLSWAASSDNSGVAGYDVYANGSKIATVTGTSYTLSGLSCGTTYTLGVEAFDASGNRSSRANASATTSACSSPPPPTGGGNLFVALNGSDSAQCTQSAPCQSFNRAYQVAKPGDVVQIAGGTYPAQTIAADATKTSLEDVVFEPAPGAAVTVTGDLSLGTTSTPGAQHVTIRDVKVTASLVTRPGTDDATFERIDAGALNVSGSGSEGVRILGGDYGPWETGPSHIKQGAQNVLIDGAVFHDFTITDPEEHSECLMIWGGAGRVTIRNSVFRNCTDFGVFVKSPGAVEIIMEQSYFDVPMPGNVATATCNPDCPRGGNSIRYSGVTETYAGSAIRDNIVNGGIGVDCNCIPRSNNAPGVIPLVPPGGTP